MALSQLQLNQISFDEVYLAPVELPEGEEYSKIKKVHPKITVEAEVTAREDFRQWIIQVVFNIEPHPETFYPYKSKISSVAHFIIDEELVKKEESALVKLVGVNGISMMYGAVREFYSLITSRCIYGSVPPLESMDFRDTAFNCETVCEETSGTGE